MIVLLDNGHGALINGRYETAGKRSPKWPDDSQLFEGEFNRAIVNGIIEQLTKLKVPYVNIAPEYRDVRLETRIKRANKYSSRNSFYLSIHSNAGGVMALKYLLLLKILKAIRLPLYLVKNFKKNSPSED